MERSGTEGYSSARKNYRRSSRRCFLWRTREEAIKLPARSVEGFLLLLGNPWPDERPSFFFQQIEGYFLDRLAAKVGILLATADHLAAQHPQMVAVSAQCAGSEFRG